MTTNKPGINLSSAFSFQWSPLTNASGRARKSRAANGEELNLKHSGKQEKYCSRLTYDHTNGFCGLYTDCYSIDPNECEQCISGEELGSPRNIVNHFLLKI